MMRQVPSARELLRFETDDEAADRQTASLAGLAVALLLVVVGLFLVHALQAAARLQDCLVVGHADCVLTAARPIF